MRADFRTAEVCAFREVFFNESEVQMVDVANCFELFEIFSNAMKGASDRLGRIVSESTQSKVWMELCKGNVSRPSYGRRLVKNSRPINVRELAIVKSCKRKVRW